jgi:hypothetical protein
MSKIQIKIEKFINDNGERRVKILSIDCKTQKDLPELYFHQFHEPYCFYDKENDKLTVYTYTKIVGDKLSRYKVGDINTELSFDCLLRDLKDCSVELCNVNKYIKQEAIRDKNWKGIFNFKF